MLVDERPRVTSHRIISVGSVNSINTLHTVLLFHLLTERALRLPILDSLLLEEAVARIKGCRGVTPARPLLFQELP